MSNQMVVLVLTALLAISEILAQIPKVKSNSVFEIVFSIIKVLARRKK